MSWWKFWQKNEEKNSMSYKGISSIGPSKKKKEDRPPKSYMSDRPISNRTDDSLDITNPLNPLSPLSPISPWSIWNDDHKTHIGVDQSSGDDHSSSPIDHSSSSDFSSSYDSSSDFSSSSDSSSGGGSD